MLSAFPALLAWKQMIGHKLVGGRLHERLELRAVLNDDFVFECALATCGEDLRVHLTWPRIGRRMMAPCVTWDDGARVCRTGGACAACVA